MAEKQVKSKQRVAEHSEFFPFPKSKRLTSDVEVRRQFLPIISCVSHYIEANPFTPLQISVVVSAMTSSKGTFLPSATHCL